MAEILTNKYIIERIKTLRDNPNPLLSIIDNTDNTDITKILEGFKNAFDKPPIVDTNHTHYPLTTLYGMTYDNVENVLPSIINDILDKKNLDGSKKSTTTKGGSAVSQAVTAAAKKIGDKVSSAVNSGMSDLSSGASSSIKYFSRQGNSANEAKHNLARILYFIALDNCDGIRSVNTPAASQTIHEMYKTTKTVDKTTMIPIRIPDEKRLQLLLFYIASTIADNQIEEGADYNPIFRFYEDLFEIQNRGEVKYSQLITANRIIESFNTSSLTLKGGVNNSVDLRLIQSILCGHIVLYNKDVETAAAAAPATKISPINELIVKSHFDTIFNTASGAGNNVDVKITKVVSKLLTTYGIAPPATASAAGADAGARV